MNIEQLKNFLVEAALAGYASNNPSNVIKEENGSTSIIYGRDLWKMDDNFFGGEPYGGREVVSYQGTAVWIMVYYGWVEESQEKEEVYTFLREALKEIPKDLPLRGPEVFNKDNFRYIGKFEGAVERFSGEEKIFKDDVQIYQAKFNGGLVDQK